MAMFTMHPAENFVGMQRQVPAPPSSDGDRLL
jgi:hypothetical protein